MGYQTQLQSEVTFYISICSRILISLCSIEEKVVRATTEKDLQPILSEWVPITVTLLEIALQYPLYELWNKGVCVTVVWTSWKEMED